MHGSFVLFFYYAREGTQAEESRFCRDGKGPGGVEAAGT